MIPMSNTSSYERFRQGQAQRRSIARSNSSLLGSIKNFVAAPFARLFTGPAHDFDDPNDLSGKRRLAINYNADNNDIVEDGPAPAKRMRVQGPSPQRSSGSLDPPSSAFRLNHSNNLFSNPPSRSASISLPSTTLPASTVHNARSTVSPLRNTFSRNMSIDSIPSNPPPPLSRDISMKSLSSIPDRSLSMRVGSRDSMPPLATQSFRLRDSSTPQPHHFMGRQLNRDVSEPPPVTVLHFNPVFVRGPSQVSEPQTKLVPTLGSLVDSQRILRSPSRQRTSLFGSSQHAVDPQAVAAERTLQELEFYKTPLVPTRIRSRMPSSLGASASSSNITDMFARKNSLILMGDHDRPTKRNNKSKAKSKSKSKETNETKPYAGTTGIRKRLAKAKAPSQYEKTNTPMDQTSVVEEKVNGPVSSRNEVNAAELLVPSPKEKDTFNVAAFPPSPSPGQQSSLRVGRAARSHLSRPIKKFSASYDDEDDQVSDEAKKDLEMLAEAAKKVPTFEIPAGFTFAKEGPPIAPAITAKEPPISALPFSLTNTAASPTPQAQISVSTISPGSGPFPSPFGSSLGSSNARDNTGCVSSSTGNDDTISKVPNFFAASKALASQPSAFPDPSPAPLVMSSGSSLPFSFGPSPVPVPTEPTPSSSAVGDKQEPEAKSNLFGVTPAATSSFSLGDQNVSTAPASASILTPAPDGSNKDVSPLPFSISSSATQPPPATSQSSPFSFSKPAESATSSVSTVPFSFGTITTPNAATDNIPNRSSFSFGAPQPSSTPSATLFGTSNSPTGDAKSSEAFLFGASNERTKPTGSSLFGASAKPASSSLSASSSDSAKPVGSTPFTFGQSSETSTDTSAMSSNPSFGSRPGVTESDKPTFGGVIGSPFSFAAPASGTSEQSKSLFGDSSSGAGDSNKLTGFTFGSSSAPSTSAGIGSTSSSFTFGGGPSSTNDTSSSPFTFGVTSARPVTPPNQDHEVRMEESPTRDIQANKPAEVRPSLGGFPFNSAPSTSTTSSLFGQSNAAPVSSGFSFGQSPGASNPFGSGKSADNKLFGMALPQGGSGSLSSFSFGHTPENEPPRPSTTGSFSFGSSVSSNTGPGPTFSFGAPSNNSAPSNPFGVAQSGSTPNSPSTFGPSSSFSFGATPTGTGNPFSFGSQPASPATPNTGLPSSGFGATTSNTFGAPPSGGSLFTIGAAPVDSNRQIKRLPNRKKR